MEREVGAADCSESTADRPPACEACGAALGVYEPLVVVEGGQARRTSLAAEPRLPGAPGRVFHLACYRPSR